MIAKFDMNLVAEQAENLCQALLSQPAYKDLRQMVEAFIGDSEAISQYEQYMNKQQMLRQKQYKGETLDPDEMDDLEREEYELYKNDTTRQFLYAQRQFEQVHDFVSKFVIKTIELDRVPTPEDFQSTGCGCGGNCGCGGGSCGCGNSSGEACACGCS